MTKTSLWKKRFVYVLRLGISMSLLGWLLSHVNVWDMIHTWTDLDWAALFPSVVFIHLLCTAIRTLRLAIILRNLGIDISPLWIWLSHLKANFIIALIPGGLAGDVYRTMVLARTSQQGLASASAIVVERLCGMAAMGIFSILGLVHLALHDFTIFSSWIKPASVIFGLIGLGTLTATWRKRHVLLLQLRRFGRFGTSIERSLTHIGRCIPDRHTFITLMGISLLLQLGIVTWYFVIALAMGLALPFLLLAFIIPLVELFLLLPVSVGGLGVREAAFSILLVPFGLSMQQAVAFALLSFTLLTVTRILSGLAFLFPYDAQVQGPFARQQPINRVQEKETGTKNHGLAPQICESRTSTDADIPAQRMRVRHVIQRFLIPQALTSLYYMLRYRCVISIRAEIELSPNITFGPNVTISSFTKIKATNGPLSVGANTGFGTSCYVSAQAGGIAIGDNCLFGPHVNILSANYDVSRTDRPFYLQGSISRGVRIGNNVWVGAGTTILDGTILGDNTIVVANSLVNRRYPPNVMLQGNPAKVIMRRTERSSHEEGRCVSTGRNGHS